MGDSQLETRMERARENGIDRGREWTRGPNKGGWRRRVRPLGYNSGWYWHWGKARASWTHPHTHTHRCLLSAASVMVRLIWLPLRKSVCFHTTLCSAKANVLNIHWVLLSISKTHTALGADKHWFLVLTEPRVGIKANISKLGCSEKISTSYELEFSLWEFPANFSKFVMRTVKYS